MVLKVTSSTNLYQISEDGEWEIDRNDMEIKQRLGDGSFGVVYEASWRKTPIAVKVLDISKNIDVTEFRTELVALTKLHHPNILKLMGACTIEKPYIIAIELMVNNINDLNSNNTSVYRSLEISLDIMRGLAYLHNRKPKCVIHRDLKPPNILLTPSGKAKIADFGLSSFKQNSGESYKMTGETGSYRYMAPEVIKSEPYGTPVDIYSFSMILFGLIEYRPFLDVSPIESICNLVVHNNGRPGFKKVKDLRLKTLITDCWFWNPNARPLAIELVSRIENLILYYAGFQKVKKGCCTVS